MRSLMEGAAFDLIYTPNSFPVHWGGDCESTWEAMAEALRGALSLTVSGFGYASHDIGGFEVCEASFVYITKR